MATGWPFATICEEFSTRANGANFSKTPPKYGLSSKEQRCFPWTQASKDYRAFEHLHMCCKGINLKIKI